MQENLTETGITADGHDRLVDGVESKARRIIETKYADEWKASGMLQRWKLKRKIDAETAKLVTEMMPNVSSEAMF